MFSSQRANLRCLWLKTTHDSERRVPELKDRNEWVIIVTIKLNLCYKISVSANFPSLWYLAIFSNQPDLSVAYQYTCSSPIFFRLSFCYYLCNTKVGMTSRNARREVEGMTSTNRMSIKTGKMMKESWTTKTIEHHKSGGFKQYNGVRKVTVQLPHGEGNNFYCKNSSNTTI